MRLHHVIDGECPLCMDILTTAHPDIVAWFITMKEFSASLHVSCAFRGEADQNKAFKDGKSKLQWPHSNHNNMRDGKPCSLALDVFAIDEDGMASFTSRYYYLIYVMTQREGFQNIVWGGTWRSFPDKPHFELLRFLWSQT